ncbi:3-isopropylmalate dehydratase small subunit [Mesorhizobium sp. LHD-90]|uniref:3-isopropylmalate dehydratase small subunit n=1 Tax=Mesorhizobium sp. LHD-90 TaxID=3071414 RepID=UPI0027DFFC1B|nr:3-isopropylmalate dehydratase small subunit [Mesorhizobium sp. LHD-90]MDQ6437549.1 3-isopropylmalate dehydratase small subunit [Mesorhizobium sp. LHD-90]
MESFTRLTSAAAPLPEADIDTDIIFPARFLLLLDRKGLGKHAFHERRHRKDGVPFVLDIPPWTGARILVTQANFGTGSSREHAVWALADFGIRCVIAESFGEIFYANCFKNGTLPVVARGEEHAAIMSEAQAGREITVDLPTQSVVLASGRSIGFDIEPHRKRSLLLGLDEIGSILADDEPEIAAFENRHRGARPWLFLSKGQLAYFADTIEELG